MSNVNSSVCVFQFPVQMQFYNRSLIPVLFDCTFLFLSRPLLDPISEQDIRRNLPRSQSLCDIGAKVSLVRTRTAA
ncbi:hypothetical protein L6452_42562 [Arctium lappa]|uniref:Uncharacterized protein n=1 Tax=Arctium lappa TaxID=4217 RepID=A0ACB8XJA0_ARCLA|nr:hypothetical protein L6452_42562 [Arctium lappa]